MAESMDKLDQFIKEKQEDSKGNQQSSSVNDKLMGTSQSGESPDGSTGQSGESPDGSTGQSGESPDGSTSQESPNGQINQNTESGEAPNTRLGKTLGDGINKWAKNNITSDTAIGASLALYSIVRVLIKAPVESYESLILTLYNSKQRKEVIPNWIGLTVVVLVLLVLKRMALGEDITVWVVGLLVSTGVILVLFGNIKPIKVKAKGKRNRL